MLRQAANKTNRIHSNSELFYSSIRNVHWMHSYEYSGGSRDRYELYNRKPEFGQDEITDKDRTPHLYWGIWENRAAVQRVVNQWGFAKDLKPEKLKRDFEKFTYFGKLDALHFLMDKRENYPWIDDDCDGAIGYCTDEGDIDERYDHKDYGKLYSDASPDYKAMILKDQCYGRPVFEWQVPWGLDEAYGYKEVSTSVDVLGNDLAQENLSFEWTASGSGGEKGGLLLRNTLTGQQLLLCNLNDAAHSIESFQPATVVMPCGAEKLLTSVRSRFSATNSTDVYGVCVGLAWSGLWAVSELWPTGILGMLNGISLIGFNSIAIYRTFFHPNDSLYKTAFAACRDADCNVVLGDWLYDDYDERQHIVSPFDEIAIKNNTPQKPSQLRKLIQSSDEKGTGFSKAVQAMIDITKTVVQDSSHENHKTTDDVSNPNWPVSYRDAVNNRRLDLIAHVLNNTEGDKILMPLTTIDDIPADLVQTLIMRRMTGQVRIDSSPLKFDPLYERVSVEMA